MIPENRGIEQKIYNSHEIMQNANISQDSVDNLLVLCELHKHHTAI